MGKARTEASRAERKAKKRAAEDAIPDVPDSWTADPEVETTKSEEKDSKKRKRNGDEDHDVAKEEKESKKERKRRRKEAEASEAVNEDAPAEVKKEKKAKKEKKVKKDVVDEEKEVATGDLDTDMADIPVDDAPKKSKKERKAERKAKEAADAAANGTETAESTTKTDAKPESNGSTKNGTEKTEETEEKKSKKNNRNREKKRKGANATPLANGEVADESSKAARFIVFVGQLPFTATKESVEKHFASIKPKSVRVPTEKGQSGKAKGYAFVEFEGYDHMKTCLKLFHHSLFNDGISAAREINVNLTAGGGGNTKERKGKIEEKNQKLDEERIRRRQEEQTAKLTKRAEGEKKDLADESAIHPSRRGRVPVSK